MLAGDKMPLRPAGLKWSDISASGSSTLRLAPLVPKSAVARRGQYGADKLTYWRIEATACCQYASITACWLPTVPLPLLPTLGLGVRSKRGIRRRVKTFPITRNFPVAYHPGACYNTCNQEVANAHHNDRPNDKHRPHRKESRPPRATVPRLARHQ